MSRYARCTSGADFAREARKSRNLVAARCTGDHWTLTGPGGRETVAASRYEYPPFLRRKIAARLMAIGLVVLMVCVVVMLV